MRILSNYALGKQRPVYWHESLLDWKPSSRYMAGLWFQDDLHLRTGLVLGCPVCGSPMDIRAEDKQEMATWNEENYSLLPVCGCGARFLVTAKTSYQLMQCMVY